MSLSECVLEIAADLEKENFLCLDDIAIVKGYIRALRAAVKATENLKPATTVIPSPELLSPEAQHATMIAKYREEFRKQKNGVTESLGEGRMAEIADGLLGGTMISIADEMPVGAKTRIEKMYYELKQDGKLHLCGQG